MVEEHSVGRRRSTVRLAGGIRRENADMSNEMRVKSPHAESPRFPERRKSEQGESVPKARLRSVVDGKQVNIPALLARGEGRTKKARLASERR